MTGTDISFVMSANVMSNAMSNMRRFSNANKAPRQNSIDNPSNANDVYVGVGVVQNVGIRMQLKNPNTARECDLLKSNISRETIQEIPSKVPYVKATNWTVLDKKGLSEMISLPKSQYKKFETGLMKLDWAP